LTSVPSPHALEHRRPTASIGFRPHTGWAIIVAVAGPPGNLKILLRGRIDLMPPGSADRRFAYHRAAELPAPEAADSIRRARATARKASAIALQDALDSIEALGFRVQSAGIPCGERAIPKNLPIVLGSHPLIHTAEGVFFQQAVVFACERCGIPVISRPERKVWLDAAAKCGLKEAGLRQQIDGLRSSVGAPWGTDQKVATAFALAARNGG